MGDAAVLDVRRDGGLAIVTLNRPDAMNALNLELKETLAAWLAEARYDLSLRAVLLTGAGRAFCAGGDLTEMDPDRPPQVARMRQDQLLRTVFLPLAELPVPVVAAVNGHAHGAGLSLALACDLVLAADNAPMSLGFVHRGLAPDCGIAHFLPRLVGTARAKELLLTGRRFDATEAHAMGLISEVVAPDRLIERAVEVSTGLARGASVALGLAKSLVNQAWECTLGEFAELESYASAVSRSSRDHREGVAAFLAKRSPEFTGA
jgi:2-(1,2-epoxy-1,2-dihydrophenyl)acetyl-CoA isomerase